MYGNNNYSGRRPASSSLIESIDGGIVPYDETEEAQMDAFNADTFGDMEESGVSKSEGFFGDTTRFNEHSHVAPNRTSDHSSALKELLRMGSAAAADRPTDKPVILPLEQVLTMPPPGLDVIVKTPAPKAPEMLTVGSMDFFFKKSAVLPPAPPPPPPPAVPTPMGRVFAPPPMGRVLVPPPMIHSPSIHVFPVRVFPTPFTARHKQRAMEGSLDMRLWGVQPMGHSILDPMSYRTSAGSLMSSKDKEFVTKIQLNQMVALSGSGVQNYKGEFTFKRTAPRPVDEHSMSHQQTVMGKKHYSSVYHPRHLVDVAEDELTTTVEPRLAVETCFDMLIDVTDIDEYISTLHPLAEHKIAEAIEERTILLEEITELITNNAEFKYLISHQITQKAVKAKDKAVECMVELLQPSANTNDAESRRTLIFRRAPEHVQARYVDMLEKIVNQ